MTWATVLPFEGHLELLFLTFGTISGTEIEPGYWATYDQLATGTETDVVRVPCMMMVSNFAQGASGNGYPDLIYGVPKMYFSTIETSPAPTTKYRLYKWSPAPTGLGNALVGGIWQTQNQIFPRKVSVSAVRIYGQPWVAGNSFQVDLITSGDQVLANGSKTFAAAATAGDGSLVIGADYAWYGPDTAPVYALGIRITNIGAANHVIDKIEIDLDDAGQ